MSIISGYLTDLGVPNHGIVDTSRNGLAGLRLDWGDWCNVRGAGFGVRSTSNTSDALTDAFVWVKPGGESDGTTDTGDAFYNADCGKADGLSLRLFPWCVFC